MVAAAPGPPGGYQCDQQPGDRNEAKNRPLRPIEGSESNLNALLLQQPGSEQGNGGSAEADSDDAGDDCKQHAFQQVQAGNKPRGGSSGP